MLGHVIQKDELPNFSDLLEYVERQLDRLVSRQNQKVDAFCEINGIRIIRIALRETRFQLGIRYENDVIDIAPLGEKERLWLERYLCAELELESVDRYSQGGGYVYYTLRRPSERYDEICPEGGRDECWWDGGAWYAHG